MLTYQSSILQEDTRFQKGLQWLSTIGHYIMTQRLGKTWRSLFRSDTSTRTANLDLNLKTGYHSRLENVCVLVNLLLSRNFTFCLQAWCNAIGGRLNLVLKSTWRLCLLHLHGCQNHTSVSLPRGYNLIFWNIPETRTYVEHLHDRIFDSIISLNRLFAGTIPYTIHVSTLISVVHSHIFDSVYYGLLYTAVDMWPWGAWWVVYYRC